MDQRFRKQERLYKKKEVAYVFTKGCSFFVFPFKIFWAEMQGEKNTFPVKVLINVSKKKFKKAVDRNKIKRLMREAYRKNKYILYNNFSSQNKSIHIALLYSAKEILSYRKIEQQILVMMEQLIREYEKNTD